MEKEIKLHDGSIYRGEYKENNGFIELSGEGHIAYPNGDRYVGEFKNGNLTGYGTYTFGDGENHCGVFINGIPNGLGLHEYNKGGIYMGQFNNGNRGGGYGLYCFPNGKIEFGLWKNNLLIEDMSWQIRTVTDFATSEFIISNYQDKNGFYLGEKMSNYTPVQGIIFYSNGEVYMGKILNSKRDGYGNLFVTDNQIVDGIWENNIRVAEY